METTLIRASPALPEMIARLRERHAHLPASYFAFLERHDGAEGDLGVRPGWFVVWPAETARVATEDYGLPEYLPGHVAFGSNGGGELFVFERRTDDADRPVFMVPAIGMALSERVPVATSFVEFQRQMGKILADA